MRIGCLLLLMLSVLGSSACTNETKIGPRDGADKGPRDGGTLVRRLAADVSTLNPIRSASGFDQYVRKYLYTPLVYLGADLQPVPGLAKSWTISNDGRTYRFALNEKATFSDGTPVRATDVLFTLRKIVDPSSQAIQVAGFFETLDIERTRAVDAYTIEVVFRQALASQLIHFADLFVIPEHIYATGNFKDDFNDLAVGSGPYKLVRRDVGKEIVLVRRSDYWREMPHIQTVIFKVIADHGTAWNALKIDQLDETILSSDTWDRERTKPDVANTIDFLRFYTINYNFIAWNNRDPLLADKRIRRALAMCIPTERIMREVYHDTARPISGPFTADEYAFNPAVRPIGFDPTEARKILSSVGWVDRDGDGILDRNGEKFAFEMLIMPGSSATTQFAQIAQAEMKKIGVVVEIRAIESAAHMQQVRAGNFTAAYLSWQLDADPDPHSLFHSSQFPPRGQNFVFYSNPEADRLIERARSEMDLAKRKEHYRRLHQVLAEDQPYAWVMQVSNKWGISRRVHGVVSVPGYGLFLWYPGEFDWWLENTASPRPTS